MAVELFLQAFVRRRQLQLVLSIKIWAPRMLNITDFPTVTFPLPRHLYIKGKGITKSFETIQCGFRVCVHRTIELTPPTGL